MEYSDEGVDAAINKIIDCYNELSNAIDDKERNMIGFKYGLKVFIAAVTLEIRLNKIRV